jgi:ubiquinone/menaquinone biosynthesis C-methylase UbiE
MSQFEMDHPKAAVMKTNAPYIPALRWKGLTPIYDAVLRWVMQEENFKHALIRQAQIQPGQQVLDLGCGTATLTVMVKQAHPEAEVTGLDGDPQVLQIGRAKAEKAGVALTLDQGMAYDLPYLEASFDRVLSSLMFHHLTTQDKQRAIQEVYRVLRPGGSFLIVDFGQPQGIWSGLVSPVMARLEEVADNHKGLLLTLLHQARFEAVTGTVNFATLFGTLYLYQGHKGSK